MKIQFIKYVALYYFVEIVHYYEQTAVERTVVELVIESFLHSLSSLVQSV